MFMLEEKIEEKAEIYFRDQCCNIEKKNDVECTIKKRSQRSELFIR